MDVSWDEKQLALKDSVIRFAQKELNDEVIEKDRTGAFPRDEWKKCADFGIQGFPFPEQYGGINKEQYLTKLCRGEFIGAHGMTEPESGSDEVSLSTNAERYGIESSGYGLFQNLVAKEIIVGQTDRT